MSSRFERLQAKRRFDDGPPFAVLGEPPSPGPHAGAGSDHEEPNIESLRRRIVEQYADHPTGTGHSFGEILCHEIHENGLTFAWLAEKWGLSIGTLGDLIADHCRRLEAGPAVDHGYRRPATGGA